MHQLNLVDICQTITFDGYNTIQWIRVLRDNLKRDNKLYILEGPIPK